MRRLRAHISRHDSEQRLRELGAHLFLGEGGFKGPDSFEVAGRLLRFNRAVIATGARPAIPVAAWASGEGGRCMRGLLALRDVGR